MEISLFGIVLLIVIIFILSGLRIINQYERGVVLTLGKYTSTRLPGLTWLFPVVQQMVKVDLRITTTDIPQQEVITKDNVPVGINAVVYFQVQNAENAILNIKDYTLAVSQYAQAALRDVIGGIELDSLLSESFSTNLCDSKRASKIPAGGSGGSSHNSTFTSFSFIFPKRNR